MPLLIALALIAGLLVLTVAMLPFAILFRYRYGTKRRRARAWIATLNLCATGLSVLIFIVTAAVTNRWVPDALSYSAAGVAAGCLLGILGLALTRWEPEGPSLHYTPSRLLVLTISVVVTARLGYGFWRAWRTWQSTPDDQSWIAAMGVAGSMAAGGVILGYYFVYWAGLRARCASG